CALHAAGLLESATIEILQTLAPLFPDADATALAAAGILLQSPADGHTCLSSEAIAERWNSTDALPEDAPKPPPIEADSILRAFAHSGAFCQPWDVAQVQHPADAAIVHAFGHYYLHRSA